MTTLAAMKTRIAEELRRSDLTTQIAAAIQTAIQAYEHERWFFNESRDNTFATIVNQANYGVTEAAFIGRITKIDYVFIIIGDQPFRLKNDAMIDIEDVSTNNTFYGQSDSYAWYNRQLYLYPIPNEIWTVRVAAVFETSAPLTDGEANNFWMTKAELLIRARAKYEIQLHVLKNPEAAGLMASAVTEAWDQLNLRTTRLVKTAGGRVRGMPF